MKKSSFSQHILFEKCPRSWYYRYIKKVPEVQEMKYMHSGKAVHSTLEQYYNKKLIFLEDIKNYFELQWTKYKLQDTDLKRDEFLLMIINGINLQKNISETELNLQFEDINSYLDAVDLTNYEIYDWKTSKRNSENEEEYKQQLKVYAWLYYRKYNIVPKKTTVFYLRKNGSECELNHIPSLESIEETKNWYYEILGKMNHYIENPGELPDWNYSYRYCPFKDLWGTETDGFNVVLTIEGSTITITPKLPDVVLNKLEKKFSYELKNSFWVKKNRKNFDGTIRFFNIKKQTIQIGFLHGVQKTLYDYGKHINKETNINIIDKRTFNTKVVEMPPGFINNITLRDYQEDAVRDFIKKEVGILQIATGGGKTEVAIEIIRRISRKTVFLVDKVDLCNQTIERIEKSLGIEVGKVGESIKNWKDINVCTIQTLIKVLDTISLMQTFKNEIFTKRFEETGIIHPKKYKSKELKQAYLINDEVKIEELEDLSVEQDNYYDKEGNIISEKEYKELVKIYIIQFKMFIKKYDFTQQEETDIISYKYIIEKARDELADILKEYPLVIFDECHKVASNSYQMLSKYLIGTKYRLGLSATPRRDDGNEMAIESVCGNPIFVKSSEELIEEEKLMKPQIYFLYNYQTKEKIKELKNQCLTGLINETHNYQTFYPIFISKNEARNNIIKRIVNKYNDKQILILVKLVEHGKLLSELLNAPYFSGEIKKEERPKLLQEFKDRKIKVLIGTVGIFAEGLDITTLDVVINACANVGEVKTIQILGRVLRKEQNKKEAIYFDFWDSGEFFYNASTKREEAFINEKYKIISINIETNNNFI
jgi:superfamily II DNA or RNA helicase